MLKEILLLILVVLLGVSVYFTIQLIRDLQASPVVLKINKAELENTPSYSENIQFYPRMRFPTKNLGYTIGEECSKAKSTNMLSAFSYIQERTSDAVIFQQDDSAPEITIRCGEEYRKEGMFVAGEGGPTKITNTTLFSLIDEGEILLLSDSCEFNVELHELLHVLGFNHSNNKNSIMYPISDCNQVLTNDIVQEIKDLYSIQSLPDLYFSEVYAVKKGSYLNLNLSIINRGLIYSGDFSVTLKSSSTIEDFSFPGIEPGAGRIFYAQNVKIPFSAKELVLEINGKEELYYDNNRVDLVLST